MKSYKTLARSALSIVARQEGRIGPKRLALHASCFLAGLSILLILSLVALASVSFLEVDFGSATAKAKFLIVAVAVWIVHYRLILRIAQSDAERDASPASSRPIVLSMVFAALLFVLSVVMIAVMGK